MASIFVTVNREPTNLNTSLTNNRMYSAQHSYPGRVAPKLSERATVFFAELSGTTEPDPDDQDAEKGHCDFGDSFLAEPVSGSTIWVWTNGPGALLAISEL